MANATQSLFQNLVNQSFQTKVDEANITLTLTQVNPNDVTSSEKYECFSILFDGPTEPALEQAMYSLSHPEAGDLDIFLVPLAKDDQGYQYEAVYNRLRETAQS